MNASLTYESSIYKIRIDYPANWKKVEKIKVDEKDSTKHEENLLAVSDYSGILVVSFVSPAAAWKDDDFQDQVAVGMMYIPKEMTLHEFVLQSIRGSRDKDPTFKLMQSTLAWLPVQNMPALKYVYRSQGLTYLCVVTIKQGNNNNSNSNTVYMMLYMANTSRYPIYLPVAQKMIDSFRIIE